ncbi:MAG: FISUMP domain-containing protein [Bacteroidales bacterium]|nr:FISUMP domain-containing protein [Bacteroidales bacterium]
MKKNVFALMIVAFAAMFVMTSCKKDEEEEGPKCESFTDARDNQTYTAVKIGSQCWMAKNLNVAVSTGSWCYDGNNTNCANYGRLYSWTAAGSACPTGWKLPSDADWISLEKSIGMADAHTSVVGWERGTDEGTKLKVNGSSGFNAQLAGKKDPGNGPYGDLSTYGYFWTSTTGSLETKAWRRTLWSTEARIFRGDFPKDYGFSVRCVKVE